MFPIQTAKAQVATNEAILASKKVEVRPESLSQYLRGLHPTMEQREKIRLLILQLGACDYVARERASRELMEMPWPPTAELVAATENDDAEISFRARKILSVRKPETQKVLNAALEVIASHKIYGVTSELLATIPLCEQDSLLAAARQAIRRTTRKQDAPILRKAIHSKNVQVRVVAILELGNTLKREATDDLYPLLKDGNDKVQLAASRALADVGDRKCLSTLLALLGSTDVSVRISAVNTLRQLSGKRLGFAAYDTAANRAKIATLWQAWIEGEGRTAKLHFPLTQLRVSYLDGKTLLAYGDKIDKVAEYDAKGKETWSYPARNPRSAEKLPNGNVLIAEWEGKRVIEVNQEGKVVWEFKLTGSLTAKRLPNGNTLIACFKDKSQVVEVNREGKVVWKYAVRGNCCAAHRLDNGNTLIAAHGASVKEVTPQGTVVWEYPVPQCHGCQPLPNGNVLISLQSIGKVIELTREKKIVWECQHPGAVDAFRLPNGNTLISGSYQFVEITPSKKIVWSKGDCVYGTARR